MKVVVDDYIRRLRDDYNITVNKLFPSKIIFINIYDIFNESKSVADFFEKSYDVFKSNKCIFDIPDIAWLYAILESDKEHKIFVITDKN